MAEFRKAIAGAVAAGVAAFTSVVPGCNLDTTQHVGIALVAGAIGFVAVYFTPNKPS